MTSLRLMRALPWRRFKKGSVLVIEVRQPVRILNEPSKSVHSNPGMAALPSFPQQDVWVKLHPLNEREE